MASNQQNPNPQNQSGGKQHSTGIKSQIRLCITAMRDEDGRTKSRELALAVTKLQEAVMWIDEHLRVNGSHPPQQKR